MSLSDFIPLPPSYLIWYNLSLLDCFPNIFFNLSSHFITWSSSFSSPSVNLQTFIEYAATGIIFVLIAHGKFTSFSSVLVTILTVLFTSPFTLSKTFLVLIPSAYSIPKNLYISHFLLGLLLSFFLLELLILLPGPSSYVQIRSLHISIQHNMLPYRDLLVQ